MFLDKETFSTVIESTPLVSIDLVVKNERGEALVGQRLNKPAQGNWFVPGGRILKDESLADAFIRLTKDELGKSFDITQASLLGPYDHFYKDNVFGEDFSTHYVAIAYELIVKAAELSLPMDIQHQAYQWLSIDELMNRDDVHLHTKWYFEKETT